AVSPDPYTFTASMARAAAVVGGAGGVAVAMSDDAIRGATRCARDSPSAGAPAGGRPSTPEDEVLSRRRRGRSADRRRRRQSACEGPYRLAYVRLRGVPVLSPPRGGRALPLCSS